MLHDHTLLKHGSRLHLQDAALFNRAVPYAQQAMVLKSVHGLRYAASAFPKWTRKHDADPHRKFNLVICNHTKHILTIMYLLDCCQYREYNGTARTCMNSGYQAIFSPITVRFQFFFVCFFFVYKSLCNKCIGYTIASES